MLHMIGVNHCDPDGETKLERLLRTLHPEFILLEGSESIDKAQELYLNAIKKEILQRNLDPRRAKLLLADQEPRGFGTRAARKYCAENSPSAFMYFDDVFDHRTEGEISCLAQRAVDSIADYDLRSAEGLLADFRDMMANFYELSTQALQSGEEDKLWLFLTDRHIGDKDIIMEQKLRSLRNQSPKSIIVTVTGLKHILRHPKQRNFYSRIADQNPNRLVLYP